MALSKRLKIGGVYYRGDVCAVGAVTGNHAVVITNTSGAVINGISITPDDYDAGEKMSLIHYDDSAGTGATLAILADDIYNVGKNATIMLDFPALELVHKGQSLKFIYNNSSGNAKNVYILSEYIGIKKTS